MPKINDPLPRGTAVLWRQYLHFADDTILRAGRPNDTTTETGDILSSGCATIHGKCSSSPLANPQLSEYVLSGLLISWWLLTPLLLCSRVNIKSPFNHYIFIFPSVLALLSETGFERCAPFQSWPKSYDALDGIV